MSSSKNLIPTSLSASASEAENQEEQHQPPPVSSPDITSSSGGFPTTPSGTADFQEPTSRIVYSVRATNAVDYMSSGGDQGLEYGRAGPPGFSARRRTIKINLGVCTESLGYESLKESMDTGGNITLQSSSSSSPSSGWAPMLRREESRKRVLAMDFPPLLRSLGESGRPRFTLMKERNEGRLRMEAVQSELPGIIRSKGPDGELRMKLDKGSDEEEKEGRDECEDGERGMKKKRLRSTSNESDRS